MPERTSPTEKGRTLHDSARRLAVAALIALASLAGLIAPADAARPRGAAGSAAAGGFVSPPPGTLTYASAGDITISWNPGDVTAAKWRVVRSSGPIDANGVCDGSVLAQEAPTTTTKTTVVEPGQGPNACYRYAVWPAASDPGSKPAYRSGTVRTLTRWKGVYNLYRKGVFSSQATIRWCVAASVQMMLNIVQGTQDHSSTTQQRYITYARRNDLYDTPDHRGSDPRGWAAALVHYGAGDTYHDVSDAGYAAAISGAVLRLRQTGKPAGLIVMSSSHAWVLTGFESTSDPALDPGAKITALRIMGPLWPRATSANGYDPPPNTRLTYEQLKHYLTSYHDSSGFRNPWEGTFVTIQP